MKKLHAKSSCCQEKIYHFGNRRRQCSKCKRTWRIRIKKRGRKLKREGVKLALHFLKHEIPSLYAKARMANKSESKLKRRLQRSRDKLLRDLDWPILPWNEPLIAIADAAIYSTEKETYTVYFILIRKIYETYAVIAPPYIRKGPEVVRGWQEAFDLLPFETKKSICALVSDGHGGLILLAKKYGWIIQRCNFHLIARIQGRRSKWKMSKHRDEGEKLYSLVNKILTSGNETDILNPLNELKEIASSTNSPVLKTALCGFAKNYRDYRSYIYYPELGLPRTSNAAESLIGSVRNISHRARGFRTIGSLSKWINAFVKNKQKIKCNGHDFQPN